MSNNTSFDNWLGLAVGNSRLHWAWFQQYTLIETWDTQHLSIAIKPHQFPQQFLANQLLEKHLTSIPVYLASVVPGQTKLWQNYADLRIVTLEDIELENIYPTLGIDRALAAWGAVETYSQACLIIDGGTALTFTGVDRQKRLVGGAISPGLRSQLTSLKQKTAALPEIELPHTLPQRWALNTDEAIASGIIYTTISSICSYIVDWQRQFSNNQVIFTGGDGELLFQYLRLQSPQIAQQIIVDRDLVFQGIKLVCQNYLTP